MKRTAVFVCLLLPSLIVGQQCIGMYNVRYDQYPVTDENVTYKNGFKPDDPSGCCDFCCESKTWPQIWNLYGNGTCRCLHDAYNDGWDGPKLYGTGDWSGACAFRRPAAVPAGLDSKKFKTASDKRLVALHSAEARYTCSYPHDPTTIAKVKLQAVESSKLPANGRFKWACGQCGAEVNDTSTDWRQTARFCATALDGPNQSLAFAEQSYTETKPIACQTVNGDFSVGSVLIGSDHGKFEVSNDSHGFPSVQQCSPDKPPIKCVPGPNGRYPCHCDAACTPACCKMGPAPEEMVVSFSWYGLEDSAPGS
jgi:hypothetical protein